MIDCSGYVATPFTVGDDSNVGGPCNDNVGDPYTYPPFTVGPFANGACAEVTVEIHANTTGTCSSLIVSRGKNDCTNPTVERVRWKQM